METTLGAKMKLGIMTRAFTKPYKKDTGYDQWLRVERMVRSWIVNAISEDIVTSFWYLRTSYELCHNLKEQFGESNRPIL